jgi:hypothetical protein
VLFKIFVVAAGAASAGGSRLGLQTSAASSCCWRKATACVSRHWKGAAAHERVDFHATSMETLRQCSRWVSRHARLSVKPPIAGKPCDPPVQYGTPTIALVWRTAPRSFYRAGGML